MILLLLSCTLLAPSPSEIEADLTMRRARSQAPAGECWMRDRIEADLDPTLCEPGPWLATYEEDRAYWTRLQGWSSRDWDADELLVLGVATSGVAGSAGLVVGASMQARALEEGADPDLVTRLARHHRTRDELWPQVLPDAEVHTLGLIVLETGGWRERRAWARLRDAIDRDPTPTPAEWEAMRPEDGTPEAMMWPLLEVYDAELSKADEAWAVALQDACREAPSAAAPCGP